MARLIDANELKRLIQSGDDLIFDAATERELIYMIDYQPTIEAEPVRHGHWLYDLPNAIFVCSECLKMYRDNPNYCPRCGAKMDGGADNG